MMNPLIGIIASALRLSGGGGGGGGSAYADLVMADSPGAYWRLNETSGTSMSDETGGHNGTIAGTYTLGIASSIDGAAVKFTSAGITPANIALLPSGGSGGFAVEFLIKLFSADSATNGYILSRSNMGDVVFNYGGANRVSIFKNTGTGGNVASNAFGPTIPRDDEWHHVVIGWNPDASRYEGYLDGLFNSSYTRTAPTLSTSFARIGRSTGDSAPFIGGLDEVVIYAHFPSPANIAARADLALGP